MQALVTVWCYLIGVTDPGAVQIATGLAAAALGLFVLRIAAWAAGWAYGLIAGFIGDYSS